MDRRYWLPLIFLIPFRLAGATDPERQVMYLTADEEIFGRLSIRVSVPEGLEPTSVAIYGPWNTARQTEDPDDPSIFAEGLARLDTRLDNATGPDVRGLICSDEDQCPPDEATGIGFDGDYGPGGSGNLYSIVLCGQGSQRSRGRFVACSSAPEARLVVPAVGRIGAQSYVVVIRSRSQRWTEGRRIVFEEPQGRIANCFFRDDQVGFSCSVAHTHTTGVTVSGDCPGEHRRTFVGNGNRPESDRAASEFTCDIGRKEQEVTVTFAGLAGSSVTEKSRVRVSDPSIEFDCLEGCGPADHGEARFPYSVRWAGTIHRLRNQGGRSVPEATPLVSREDLAWEDLEVRVVRFPTSAIRRQQLDAGVPCRRDEDSDGHPGSGPAFLCERSAEFHTYQLHVADVDGRDFPSYHATAFCSSRWEWNDPCDKPLLERRGRNCERRGDGRWRYILCEDGERAGFRAFGYPANLEAVQDHPRCYQGCQVAREGSQTVVSDCSSDWGHEFCVNVRAQNLDSADFNCNLENQTTDGSWNHAERTLEVMETIDRTFEEKVQEEAVGRYGNSVSTACVTIPGELEARGFSCYVRYRDFDGRRHRVSRSSLSAGCPEAVWRGRGNRSLGEEVVQGCRSAARACEGTGSLVESLCCSAGGGSALATGVTKRVIDFLF